MVVVLFDGGGHHPGYSDPVAAHHRGPIPALLIQYRRLEGSTVFVPQLEDMTHLDTPGDSQSTPAIGAGIPGHHITQIRHLGFGQVPDPIDPAQVPVLLIGATDEVGQLGRRPVGDHRHVQPQGAQGTGPAAGGGAYLGLRGKGQGRGHLGQFFGLKGIEFMVTPQT